MSKMKRFLALVLAMILTFQLLPLQPMEAAATEVATQEKVIATYVADVSKINWQYPVKLSDDVSIEVRWDEENIYIGVSGAKAGDFVTVNIANKTITKQLEKDNGVVTIPFSSTGIAMADYNQHTDFAVGVGSVVTDAMDLTFALGMSTDVASQLYYFPTHYNTASNASASKEGVYVIDNETKIDATTTAGASATGAYFIGKTHTAAIDHNAYDLYLQQTVRVDALPESAFTYNGSGSKGGFVLSLIDRVNGNGMDCQTMAGIIVNQDGKLVLMLNDTDSVDLGKTLGDTFVLGMQWNKDGSADVYVDELYLGSVQKATLKQAYNGNDCASYYYNDLNSGDVKVTVSEVCVWTGIPASAAAGITEDVVKNALTAANPTANLALLEGDLVLPSSLAAPYLGQMAITWESSNTAIIANDGKVTAPAGANAVVTLTAKAGVKALASFDITVKTSGLVLTDNKFAAGLTTDASAIVWDYPVEFLSTGATPAGALNAYWDKDNLYIGVSYQNAEKLTLTVNGKALPVYTLATTGEEVITVAWADVDTVVSDYNQVIRLQAVLEDAEGKTAQIADTAAYVYLTLPLGNSIYNFPTHLNTATVSNINVSADGVYDVDNETVIDAAVSAAAGQTAASMMGKTHTTAIDHIVRDMLISQDIQILAMPESTFKYGSYGTDSKGGLVISAIDRVNGNGMNCQTMAATVVNVDGALVLYFSDTATVELGKRVGDAFKLGIQWNRDNTADVYVDGIYVGSAADVTRTLAYNGNDCLSYDYNILNEGNAKIQISHVAVYEGIPMTVADEIDLAALVGDLSSVVTDVTLPATFATTYLGDVAIRWESSDTAVISNAGKVTQPTGADAEVTLTAYAGTTKLGEVKATVKKNASASDDVLAVPYSANQPATFNKVLAIMGQSAAAGNLGAAWNKDTLFLAVDYSGAASITITVGDYTVTEAVSGTGKVYSVPFAQTGITELDYNKAIPVQVILTDAEGKTAKMAENADKLYLTIPAGKTVQNVGQGNFPSAAYTPGFAFVSGNLTLQQNAAADADYYATSNNIPNVANVIDHINKDIMWTQTITVNALPVNKPVQAAGAGNISGFYFYMNDRYDFKDNMLLGVIYNTGSGLKLFINGADVSVDLGVRVGDTFTLATQWNRDDVVDVYVNGILLQSVAGGTTNMPQGQMGNHTMGYGYRNLAGRVDVVVTGGVLSEGIPASISREITAENLIPGVDLSAVRSDLSLNTTFASAYLGDVNVTWSSSNTSVLENNGKIHRADGKDVTVQLSAVYNGNIAFTQDVTVKMNVPAKSDKLAAQFAADVNAITWNYTNGILGGEGAPQGGVSACWNKDLLVVGLEYGDATSATIAVNGKTIEIDLVHASSTTAGVTVVAANSLATVTIPMDVLEVAVDYNVAMDFVVTLTNENGSASSAEAGAGKLYFCLTPVTAVYTFPLYINTYAGGNVNVDFTTNEGIYVIDNETAIDALTSINDNSTNQAYLAGKTYTAAINHLSYDLLAQQTICIEAMPEVAYSADGTGSLGGLVIYLIDRVENNGANCQTMYGTIVNEGGKLYLYVKNSEKIDLGVKLGDTFKLGLQWNKNDSVDVYVNNMYITSIEDATAALAYNGNDNLGYNYNQLDKGNVKITITEAAVWEGIPVSRQAEITAEKVLGNQNLSEVVADLTLPTTFTSAYLGETALTWASSDESVIAADGKVNRPLTEDATVTLTVSADGIELWSVEATVIGKSAKQNDIIKAFFTESGVNTQWGYNNGILGDEYAPFGKLAAAWDSQYLYIALEQTDAAFAIVHINGKDIQVELTDSKQVISLAWSDIGTDVMYNKTLDCYVELTNANGSAASAAADKGKLVTLLSVDGYFNVGKKANPDAITGFAADVMEGIIVLDTLDNANGAATVAPGAENAALSTGWDKDFIDHSINDLILEQTILVEAMPVTEPAFYSATTSNGFTFYMGNRVDGVYTDVDLLVGSIHNTADGLVAVIAKADGTFETIKLNKALGEAFNLGTQWNKDNSVDVYVDNIYVTTVENATVKGNNGEANGTVHYAYTNVQEDTRVVISNATVSNGLPMSITDEMTAVNLIGANSLAGVRNDITLPTVYNSKYLGECSPIVWTSSNEAVIDGSGKVTRPVDGDETVVLTASYKDQVVCTVTATVVGVIATSSDSINAFHHNGEVAVADRVFSAAALDAQGKAVAAITASWNKDNLILYFDMYAEAESISVTVGNATKTFTVTGEVFSGQIAMSEIFNWADFEYNMGLDVAVSVDSTASFEGKLYLRVKHSDTALYTFPWYINTYEGGVYNVDYTTNTGVYVFDTEKTIDGFTSVNTSSYGKMIFSGKGQDQLINHYKYDLLWESTITIEAMPAQTYKFDGTNTNGLHMYMIDRVNGAYDDCKTMYATIINDNGKLVLCLAKTGVKIDLGKGLGETFKLGLQWNMNNSVDVYVDDIYVQSVKNVTLTEAGNGQDNITYIYNNLRDDVKIVITDVAVYDGIPASVAGELVATKVLASINTLNVMNDVVLPTSYESPYIGRIDGISWKSADVTVISGEGKVTRPDGADKKVAMTAIFRGAELWTENFVVKANAPIRDSISAVNTTATAVGNVSFRYTNGFSGAAGTPTGSLGAAWTGSKLYIGAEYKNATKLTVVIGDKSFDYALDTAATTFATEIALSDIMDLNDLDYNASIPFYATLSNEAGSSATSTEAKGKLYFSLPVNGQFNVGMKVNGSSTTNFAADTKTGEIVFDNKTNSNGASTITNSGNANAMATAWDKTLIDHDINDLMLQQTFFVEAMPKSAPGFIDEQGTTTARGLTFWIGDRGAGDWQDIRLALFGLHNTDDGLVLYVASGATGAGYPSGTTIKLGRKVGEKFTLGTQWNKDNSVDVYVDGVFVKTVKDVTRAYVASQANSNVNYKFANLSGDTRIVITDATVSVGIPTSLAEEMAPEVILGQEINAVRQNLAYSTVYDSPYMGQLPITLVSSNPSVLNPTTGAVVRDFDKDVKVNLTLKVRGETYWTEQVIVKRAYEAQKNELVAQHTFKPLVITTGNFSGYQWNYTNGIIGESTDVYGNVAAQWDKDTIYLGMEYTGAKTATIHINGKTIEIDLVNNAASLADVKVASKNGLAEILIPMAAVGLKLQDYEVSAKMQVILSNGEITAQSATSKGTIRFTTSEVVSMYMNLGQAKPDLETAEGSATFTDFHTIPDNFKIGNGKVVITANAETEGASMGTKYISNVDHNRNMKLYQTICIDQMPSTTAKWNDLMNYNGYYFYVADRCIDPGVQSSHCRMVYCEIVNENGELKLCVSGGVEEKFYVVDLGMKLGQTFELATLWEADDSFAVYVNGKKLGEWEDMTYIISGYGMDLVMLGYKTLQPGNGKVTVSDIKLTYTPFTSITQEVTAFSVFQDEIPVMVEDHLTLPQVYNSIYLGEMPLSWSSSNTEYLSNSGKVTRPVGVVNGVTVDLTMKMAGRKMFTVSPLIKSAATASLPLIDAAFVPEGLVVDGAISEDGWSMNTSLLSPGGKQPVNFGAQWDLQNLYLAVKAEDLNKLNINLNNQKVTLGKGGVTYTTGATYTEIKIPFKALGLEVKDYGIKIPVEMTYEDASYVGDIRLSSIDWISTDNMEHRSKHLFSTSDSIPNLGTAISENGFYLFDHYDGSESGVNYNSTKATNYIRFSKKFPGINTVIPVWPKDETYYMSFDFQAASMPVYSGACIAPNIRAANYGFQFYIAGERSGPDGDAQADLVVGGIYNSGEKGLMLILSGEVSLDVIPLNRYVGDLMRIAIACEEDGDVTVFLDGEPIHFQENTEKRLSGMISYNEDAAVSFGIGRDQNAPKSEADNFDIYISNFALGTYYGEELLDSLTFDKFGGLNCNQYWDEEKELSGVTMDMDMIYEFANKQLTEPTGLTWTSSNPDIVNVETGKVTRPETNGQLVTVTVTTDTGKTKSFDMYVKGMNPEDTYLWTYRDIGAYQNPGEVLDVYRFILDEDNNSLIFNQKESKPFNVVKLTDDDEFARLHTDFLELYVSDDNVTYTQIEDFKLLQVGRNWYLYDFQATGQYVKVHCTQLVGDEADFEALLQGIITVYQEDVFGQGEGTFATETSVTVKNDTGLDARDEAWHIPASDLGDIFLTDSYADVRFYLNGKALYHYYENGDFVVRIPELANGSSVKLDVKAGNASALDVSNKEYVHEIIYGVRELWNPSVYMNNRMARYFTFPDGTIMSTDIRSDGNGAAICFSYDGGLTWTKSEVLKESQGFVTNVTGFIWDSYYNRLYLNTHNTKEAGGTRMHLLYTEDQGVTWHHPKNEDGTCGCPPSSAGSNYVDGIELCTNDGEGPGVDMIMSAGGTHFTETGARQGLECTITYTTDGGKNWVLGRIMHVEEANTIRNGQSTENGFSESCLWEMEDGTVVLYVRWQTTYMSHFGVYYSYDHGITWTEDPEYSEVYTVNTNPVSHRWKGENLLVWSGNAAFGGDSYRRTPVTIGIFDKNDPKLKHLTVLQDVYLRSSLQSLDTATQQQATNPSIGTSLQSDTAFVEWFNNFNAVYSMNIRHFTDFMYKTKGAYDSFEGRTMKYEGWSQAYGTFYVSDEQASHGNRSLFVGAATVLGRSIGYMEQGTVSMDVYVADPTMDMQLELQTGYSNDEMQRTSPVKVKLVGGKLTGTDLQLQEGWNTIKLDVDLSESKADLTINGNTASLVNLLLGTRTEMLRDPLEPKPKEVTSDDIAFDISIGKYISWVRFCPMGDVYMDNFLVVDNDPLLLPLGSDGSWEGDDDSDGNFFANYWWIFVIVALIAAGVVVLIMAKGKGAAAAAAAAPEATETPNE